METHLLICAAPKLLLTRLNKAKIGTNKEMQAKPMMTITKALSSPVRPREKANRKKEIASNTSIVYLPENGLGLKDTCIGNHLS